MTVTMDAEADLQIARERTQIMYRNAPIGVLASCQMGIVTAGALAWDEPSIASRAAFWSVLLIACMIFHLAICRAFGRARDPQPALWIRLFVYAALFEGLSWGLGVFLFASQTHYYRQIIMLVLSSGLVASTAFVLSTQLAPFRAFFYPAMLPHLVVQLIYPYPLHILAELATGAFILSVTIATQRSTAQVVEVLRLRFQNEALARDLKVQIQRAEEANLAKSRFLAAASHDLRQPVHAMAMFVGALRGQPLDSAALSFIDNIDGSLSALDELFAALLDISKLDAGVVDVGLANIPVDALLKRICKEQEAAAAAKGLDLRRTRSSLIVRTDPVLLERVVRNLVTNAVKYTDYGRISVGCRREAGHVTIVVGDTGRGIARDDLDRVFDEFFQVGNPGRNRSQGLGLGLAIVRRILPLIEGTVSLTSRPGGGSLFKVRIPRAFDISPPALPISPADLVAPSKDLILVIDDEDEILSGMAALLKGWGHEVLTASSATALLDKILPGFHEPGLIICDYRLRGGETGLNAISQVRAALGSDLAALLITGDTAPHRLAEAQSFGIPVLHKPVSVSKLRAAIRNLARSPPSLAVEAPRPVG
jgi:signal transduction histidine kinase/CheY-like chemotaxis protein